jgi:hypothetical protein
MKYDQFAYALRRNDGPSLGTELATFWVVLWRAWRKTFSAPFRLGTHLLWVKRYSWLEWLLTFLWCLFVVSIVFGIGTLLYGDPTFLRIVVLVWTVPCMAYYGLTEWLNILDDEDEDGGWG